MVEDLPEQARRAVGVVKSTPEAKERSRIACEAALLLNESVRELVVPQQLVERLTENIPEGPVPIAWLGAVRHTAIAAAVIQLARLHEIRENFLVPWLYTDAELKALGLPQLEEFLGTGKLKYLWTLRHQYAGHPTAAEANGNRAGRVISPSVLGEATRELQLGDAPSFLRRMVDELATGVEAVVADLRVRFPETELFVKEAYPLALERAMLAQRPRESP